MAAPQQSKSSFHKGKQQQQQQSSSKKRKYDGGGSGGGGGYKSSSKASGYNKTSHDAGNNNSSNSGNNDTTSDHHHGEQRTPSNKKRALRAERQSYRKHAPVVRSAKTIWNELRLKTNDATTNDALCAELHGLLRGKCMEVAMQHDASRCVQGVLQFGTEDMKRDVVMELCRRVVDDNNNVFGSGDAAATTAATGGKKGAAVTTASSANNNNNSNNDKATMKKDESKMNLAELCKIQYAHFVVLKMIKYCARDEVCVKLIVKSLKKQMTKLAVHSVASRVIELLFATFPSKFTSPLKLELYGPQYALFANTNIPTTTTTVVVDNTTVANTAAAAMTRQLVLPTLEEFVRDHPNKREPTLVHMQSLVQKGIDKCLVGFAYFHALLHDYITIASRDEVRSFLAPSLADHALHLLSTRHGTRVVCDCLAYASVKDRKRMLKCLRGYTRSSLLHRDAYLAILRACDVMDDTVLVNKMLFAELHQNPIDDTKKKGIMVIGGSDNDDDDTKREEEVETSPILDLVLSDTGSKLFLLLLVSKEEEVSTEHHVVSKEGGNDKATATSTTLRWQKYFDPYELSILHRNPTITEKGEDGPVPTSKKADEIRRQELVAYLKELLLGVCTSHAKEILRSKTGSRVLMEVCESYPSVEVYNAIVEACCASTTNGGSDNDDVSLSMFEDPVGHLTLKNIFLSESKNNNDNDDDDDDDDEPTLARALYSKFQTRLGELATSNRGAFVLAALMGTCVGKEVRAALMDHKKDIAKLAIGGGKEKNKKLAGCGVLLELLKKK